jgi:hypothetical protein
MISTNRKTISMNRFAFAPREDAKPLGLHFGHARRALVGIAHRSVLAISVTELVLISGGSQGSS